MMEIIRMAMDVTLLVKLKLDTIAFQTHLILQVFVQSVEMEKLNNVRTLSFYWISNLPSFGAM
jgi:hypothetical protein